MICPHTSQQVARIKLHLNTRAGNVVLGTCIDVCLGSGPSFNMNQVVTYWPIHGFRHSHAFNNCNIQILKKINARMVCMKLVILKPIRKHC